MSGYSRINAGMNYSINNDIELKTGMTNITDEQPIVDEPTTDMILQGRAVFISASMNF